MAGEGHADAAAAPLQASAGGHQDVLLDQPRAVSAGRMARQRDNQPARSQFAAGAARRSQLDPCQPPGRLEAAEAAQQGSCRASLVAATPGWPCTTFFMVS